jgi:hypothetical protein
MPRIVTAMFQDRAQAEQALRALMETGIAQSHITAIGFSEGREVSSISGFRTLSARDDSHAALHDLNLPSSDLLAFEQGLHRGCSLIAARVDRENIEEAIRVLEMFDPVDLDRHSRDAASAGARGANADSGAPLGAGITGGSTAGTTNTGALPGMGLVSEASDDLGTADLRTDETAQSDKGLSTTTGTAVRRDDERADREGVNELALQSNPPPLETGPFQRFMNRGGRVWAYGTIDEGTL